MVGNVNTSAGGLAVIFPKLFCAVCWPKTGNDEEKKTANQFQHKNEKMP
jgi:hypothetical protein